MKLFFEEKSIFIGALAVIVTLFLVILAVTQKGERRQQSMSQEERVAQELRLQAQVADIIKTKDITKCNAVNDALYATVCANNIALNLAQEQNNISYCANLDDKLVSRSQCEQQVVFSKSLQEENIAICKEAVNPDTVKRCEESFYTSLALKKSDSAVCFQISEKSKQDMCHNQIVLSKSNYLTNPETLVCGDLRSLGAQEDCALFKKAASSQVGQEALLSFCQKQKTNLFQNICGMFGGVNSGLTGNINP